jgi:hypothetical protein
MSAQAPVGGNGKVPGGSGGAAWAPTEPVDVPRLVELTRSLHRQNLQLRTALESRVVIEQAKGVLAERLGIELDEAFRLLRSAARSHRLKLHLLAERVVTARETPHEIEAQRGRARP